MIGYDFYNESSFYYEEDQNTNTKTEDKPAVKRKGPTKGDMLVAAGAVSAAGAVAFNKYAKHKIAEKERQAAEAANKGIVAKIAAFIKSIFKAIINAVKKLVMKHKVKEMVKMYRKIASRNPDIANAPVNATVLNKKGKLKKKVVRFGKLIALIDQNLVQYSRDMDEECRAIIKSVEEGKGKYKRYNYDIAQSMRLRRKMMMANLVEANNQLKVKDYERSRSDARENLKMAKQREMMNDWNDPDAKAAARDDVEKYERELRQLDAEWRQTERDILRDRAYANASINSAMY